MHGQCSCCHGDEPSQSPCSHCAHRGGLDKKGPKGRYGILHYKWHYNLSLLERVGFVMWGDFNVKNSSLREACVCCSLKTQRWFFRASSNTCCLESVWGQPLYATEERSCFDDVSLCRLLTGRIKADGSHCVFDSYGWVVGFRGGLFSHRNTDLNEMGPIFNIFFLTKTVFNLSGHKRTQRWCCHLLC